MNRIFTRVGFGIFAALLMMNYSNVVFAIDSDYLNNFPAMCSEASDRYPLPGHIIRLGFVANTPFGWSFFFPEQRSSGMLERVPLLDNVGKIGQNPEDFSDDIRLRTGAGYFVIAHIFVGDSSSEPFVTCVSMAMSMAGFQPSIYGPGVNWLDNDSFDRWLNFRRYGKWDWRRYWKFDRLRTRFDSFWRREGSNKYKRFKQYRRFRDDNSRRSRDDNEHRKPLRDDNDKPRRIGDIKKRIGDIGGKWPIKKPNSGRKPRILPITKPDPQTEPGKDRDWRERSARHRGFKMPDF